MQLTEEQKNVHKICTVAFQSILGHIALLHCVVYLLLECLYWVEIGWGGLWLSFGVQ